MRGDIIISGFRATFLSFTEIVQLLYFLLEIGGFMARGKEGNFQSELIEELEELFPGCIVLKNDEQYIQGIPDLTIFYKDKWAMLECKKSAKAHHQPNQDYYVHLANEMSFARCIHPENKKEVLDELQRTLGA